MIERFKSRVQQRLSQRSTLTAMLEVLILFVVTAFFLFYGMVPLLGGAQLGLVGADEPRYAQVAREMLAAHNSECTRLHVHSYPTSFHWQAIKSSYRCLTAGTVTPILYGEPWLEKPALYYWRTMSFFKEFGVTDWVARLPSATGAFALIVLIYLHMRRFRPGGHLDAALITLSCVGIIGFARGASTDMQLAAPFCIGMLGWYAWYETGKKFWLFDLYFFVGAATLAKGPVAPFMALCIILLFTGLRREWSLLKRTIWIPGVLLYLLMVLPWYIAVQRRNPTFYKLFFLEHNLQRFATDRYQHHQIWYFYIIVLLLALMPWTVLALRAIIDSIDISIAEWKVRHNPARYLGHTRAGDAFPEFLVLWALFPVVFFSFSGSKLPGYILPALPPITILTGDYLYRLRTRGLKPWLLVAHAFAVAVVVFVLLLSPSYMVYNRMLLPTRAIVSAAAAAIAMAVIIMVLVARFGVARLRTLTLIPAAMLLFFLLRLNGRLLDFNYSARPLARIIQQSAPGVPTLAEYDVRRDIVYGLAFYRDEPIIHYGDFYSPIEERKLIGVPPQEHILVVREDMISQLPQLLAGRIYEPLFLYPWQGLAVYRVYPAK